MRSPTFRSGFSRADPDPSVHTDANMLSTTQDRGYWNPELLKNTTAARSDKHKIKAFFRLTRAHSSWVRFYFQKQCPIDTAVLFGLKVNLETTKEKNLAIHPAKCCIADDELVHDSNEPSKSSRIQPKLED